MSLAGMVGMGNGGQRDRLSSTFQMLACFSPGLFNAQPELSERSLQVACCRGGSDFFR